MRGVRADPKNQHDCVLEMKSPKLIREARVAYHCPEIRRAVLAVMVLRCVKLPVLVVTAVLAAPLLAVQLVGMGIDKAMCWLRGYVCVPFFVIDRAIQSKISRNHAKLPVAEIRRRVYGEEPDHGSPWQDKENQE